MRERLAATRLACAVLLVLIPDVSPTVANGWFPTSDDVLSSGTVACSADGGAVRCFGLRCNGDNPPPGAEWFPFVGDAGLDDAPLQVRLSVDGRLDAAFLMNPLTVGGYLQHVTPVDLPGHSGILNALQGGHRWLWITAGEVPPFSLSLAGSSDEIDRASAVCALSGRPDRLSSPICDVEYRARIREAERLDTLPSGRLAAEGMRLDAEVRLNLCRQGIPTTKHEWNATKEP